MNPYKRAALMLIRLVGAGFVFFGATILALYLIKSHLDKSDVQASRCLWLGIPVLIGLVILIKSSAIARRLTQDFDE